MRAFRYSNCAKEFAITILLSLVTLLLLNNITLKCKLRIFQTMDVICAKVQRVVHCFSLQILLNRLFKSFVEMNSAFVIK